MKKILGLALIFVVGSFAALSAGTWTNFAGFGWNLPMDETFTADDYNNGEEIVLENQTGLEGFFMGFNQNGFAVKSSADINWSGINHEMNGVPYAGVNVNLQVGAGFAPLRSNSFTLALFGMVGLDASAFYSESTRYDTAFNENITSKYTEGQIAYMLGGNITAIYTPTESFSVFASCSVNRVTSGLYVFKAEFSDVYANSDDSYETNPTLKIIPTIGVCWKF